jgi:epoxyqueuosine reductase
MEEVRSMLVDHDVHHVEVTGAEVLSEARVAIVERKAAGLHDGMEFTFRNPQRSTDPRRAVEGARSVIVAARAYLPDRDPDPSVDAVVPARVARYAWVDHYGPLRAALREVALRLRRAGQRAVAFADDNSLVDRAVAERAGLGWFGKNANILLPGAGSFFVLGSVVTTAWYPPKRASIPDGCGTCSRCIDACPTDAIVEPGVIDAGRCLSWIGQKPGTMAPALRAAMHDRIYGCDDCQDACPISVRLGRRNTIGIGPTVQAWVDALELLRRDDDWILERYGRWYIADRDVTWLRRNALVIVGNVGDPCDPRLAAVVEGYRSGPDPILAEHATWARSRLDERRLDQATR